MTKNKIEITEVGLRDGLQSLNSFIPTEKKIQILDQIVTSGIKNIELTSFVSPKHVPQLADSKEISRQVLTSAKYEDVNFSALVPNLRGAMDAYKCGFKNIRFFVSASETHNLKNTNQTVEHSLEELSKIRESLPDVHLSVILATVFGCPYEGQVPISKIIATCESIFEIGADDIGLADTYGRSTRENTEQILSAYLSHFTPHSAEPKNMFELKIQHNLPFLHLHNLDGNVYDNVDVALSLGFTRFDSAFGGLGGCPAITDFHGNLATEGLVQLLESKGLITHNKYINILENYKKITEIL